MLAVVALLTGASLVAQANTSTTGTIMFGPTSTWDGEPLTCPASWACGGANCYLSCSVANDTCYEASDCSVFIIECDVEWVGGGLSNSPQDPGSFGSRVDICASDETCLAVALDSAVSGTCV